MLNVNLELLGDSKASRLVYTRERGCVLTLNGSRGMGCLNCLDGRIVLSCLEMLPVIVKLRRIKYYSLSY